jgi:hypothetical protein
MQNISGLECIQPLNFIDSSKAILRHGFKIILSVEYVENYIVSVDNSYRFNIYVLENGRCLSAETAENNSHIVRMAMYNNKIFIYECVIEILAEFELPDLIVDYLIDLCEN